MVSSPLISDKNNPYDNFTEEEFVELRYNEIKEWHKNPSTHLFEFRYFDVLPVKRRISSLFEDISFVIFNIICSDYYRNAYGSLTRSLEMTVSIDEDDEDVKVPFVKWTSSKMELQYEPKGDRIVIYESIQTNLNYETRLVVGEQMCDCSNQETINEAILKLEEEFSVGTRKRTLDTIDFDILTAVFNNMTFEVATSVHPLDSSLKDLVADIYSNHPSFKEHSKALYVDTLERLFKLATYHISLQKQDASGKLLASSVKSFFDLDIILSENNIETNDKTVTTIQVSNSFLEHDWNKHSVKEFNEMHLRITPSIYMKEQWTAGVHSAIFSKTYKQIPTSKGRFLLLFLQSERIKHFPECEVRLALSHIKTHIRFSKNTSERVKKEISQELTYFKSQKILIQDFHFEKGYLCISFLPFTTNELSAYRLNSSLLLEES